MFILSRKMVRAGVNECASYASATYEDAIKALNSLQGNAAYIRERVKNRQPSTTLKSTEKYLERCGISLDRLDGISVIHVAGTKGKGSVCAFTDSLLRAHGVRTGVFTSPHLVSVRERFRINGKPIEEEQFVKYFFRVYNRLQNSREHNKDMPPYFHFLTVLMFNLFLELPIDVAIIEVGIGGENDCTNAIRSPVCVGVTSLALEHTALLGDTLEEIAYQKSGIFKSGTRAFSVPQPEEAARVLVKRAQEKGCALGFVPPIESYHWIEGMPPVLGIAGDFQSQNASLALRLSSAWLESDPIDRKVFSFATAASALSSCKWPGRTQLLQKDGIDFYIDGAHTAESIQCCVSWFRECVKDSPRKRFLLYNTTAGRDSTRIFPILRSLNFDKAFFAPNIAGEHIPVDQITNAVSHEEKIAKCRTHCDMWGEGSVFATNVTQVLRQLEREKKSSDEKINLLVTGSLHLAGAVLTVIDPDLATSYKV